MRTNSHQWLEFFRVNAARTLPLETDHYHLTREERERITPSIQKFQLGEGSEGRSLKAKADRHAMQTGDALYPETIRFLIREENRHSAYLGHFMREKGIPMTRSTWTDGIFRQLRNFAGLELSVRVLVTAEIIAVSYYASLATATDSPLLKRICERMKEEELEHIRFQMLTIRRSALARRPITAAFSDIAHALFMFVTTAIVAVEHRHVIRSRSSLASFVVECFARFREAMDEGRAAAGARWVVQSEVWS